MGSLCGTNPQTVVQTASNPNVTAQQNQVYGMVNQYANQFGGAPSALIAPQNQLQTAAEQGVANYSTANQPWGFLGEGQIGQGAGIAGQAPSLYGQGAAQLGGVNQIAATPWNPTPYQSPYTQDVIDATMRNIQQQNAIQQNGALGTAIQSGNAFGGDRAGVAQAELARNQALAQNQVMAGLQQANFNQASQQANAQQQYLLNLGLGNNAQLMQQASGYGQLGGGLTQAGLGLGNLGYQTGNLGNLSQQSTLGALQGLYNMGVGLQGTQQQQLSAPLTLGQWYANASPGTQAVPTSTTYPGSNPLSTIAGLGTSAIGALGMMGMFANRGGRVGKDAGGGVVDDDDIVSRFHNIRGALHRAAGGQGGVPAQQPQQGQMGSIDPLQLAMNVPPRQNAVTDAADRQRMYRLMSGVSNSAAPAQQQAAEQMLATPQVSSRGGAIHKYGGGGMTPDGGGDLGGDLGVNNNADAAPTLAGSVGALTSQELTPQDKMRIFKNVHKLADTLLTPNTANSQNPTKAPQAPGTNNTLASLGQNPLAQMQYLKTAQQLGNMFTDDTMSVNTGGRIHKQNAGSAGEEDAEEGEGDETGGNMSGYTYYPPRTLAGLAYHAPNPNEPNVARGSLAPTSDAGPTPSASVGSGSSSLNTDQLMQEYLKQQIEYRKKLPYLAMMAFGSKLIPQRNSLGIFSPVGAGAGEAAANVMNQGYKSNLGETASLVGLLQNQKKIALEEAANPAKIESLQGSGMAAKMLEAENTRYNTQVTNFQMQRMMAMRPGNPNAALELGHLAQMEEAARKTHEQAVQRIWGESKRQMPGAAPTATQPAADTDIPWQPKGGTP